MAHTIKKAAIFVVATLGFLFHSSVMAEQQSVIKNSSTNNTQTTNSSPSQQETQQKSASQSESRWYAGFGIGAGSVEFEAEGNSVATADDDYTSFNIKVGVEAPSRHKLELTYEASSWDKFSDEHSGVNLDWYIPFSKAALRPYIMIGFGAYTYEDTADMFEDNKDLAGVALNFGAGLFFDLNANIELEAGYKFKYIKWEDVEVPTSCGPFCRSYTTVESNTTMSGLEAAIRFKF